MPLAAERLESVERMRAFAEGSEGPDFAVAAGSSRNGLVRRVPAKFRLRDVRAGPTRG